jgi:hypothetical protein
MRYSLRFEVGKQNLVFDLTANPLCLQRKEISIVGAKGEVLAEDMHDASVMLGWATGSGLRVRRIG